MNRLLLVGLAMAAVGGVVAGVVVATRDSGSDTVGVSGAGGGARAWIDHPLEGSEFPLGQTIAIRWHASAPGGVSQVEVRANGERVALAQDLDPSAQIVTQRHEWAPTQPGEYLIEVIATGSQGGGATAENRVRIAGQDMVAGPVSPPSGPVSPPSGPVSPSPGPVSPPPGPTASATAGTAPTAVPASATKTPAPAPSPTTVAPTRTPIVPPPTSTSAPLPPTATPVPHTSTPSPLPPTPTPTPPPDTQGPPAPNIVSPKNDVALSCFEDDVILDWEAPPDPSGISNYRVRLQVTSGSDWADVKVWDPVIDTQVNANADTMCGGFYRWRVMARDGAGNSGEVSGWGEFSITLD